MEMTVSERVGAGESAGSGVRTVGKEGTEEIAGMRTGTGAVAQGVCSVRERLEDYKSLVLEIELLEGEKYRLRQGYLSARVLDGMPRAEGRHCDHVSSLAARLIDMQKIIDQRLDLLIDTRMGIESLFDGLSPDERNLLHLRYIDGLGWEDISDKMAFSLQWLHILHRRTLKKAEELNKSKCR